MFRADDDDYSDVPYDNRRVTVMIMVQVVSWVQKKEGNEIMFAVCV